MSGSPNACMAEKKSWFISQTLKESSVLKQAKCLMGPESPIFLRAQADACPAEDGGI